MTGAGKYAGTPWAVLYPQEPTPPTQAELEEAARVARSKKKWQQELARREKRKTAAEQVLRDNKQFSNWTI